MKIAVCVSLVPDSTTKVKIGSSGKSIDENGVTFILNPYDEYAVEAAVQLKEKSGAETFAISFGTDKSKEAIKKAYQMGVEKGILIKASSDDYDNYTVAKNLADVLDELKPEMVFFGKQSIDFDGMAIPAMVATLLNLPFINVVTNLDINENEISVEREIEGGKEVIVSALPAIIGAQKGLNNPRYPNLKSIMASKSKPIEERNASFAGNKTEIISMTLPPAKGKGKILENGAESAAELVRLLRDEAKII